MSSTLIFPRQRGFVVAVAGVAVLAGAALLGDLILSGRRLSVAGEALPAGGPLHAPVVGLSILLMALLLIGVLRRLSRAEARHTRAIADLAASEANLRALSDNAIIGISVLRDGRYVLANRHVALRLGYSVEELRRIAVADVIHPDDRAVVLERYRRRLAGEEVPSRYETRLITKAGGTLTVEVSAAMTRWDGQPADMVFTTDITARKAAEAELVAVRANLNDAIESIEHAIVLWDSEDRLALFNQRFKELFPDDDGFIKIGLAFEDFVRVVAGHDLVAGVPGQEIQMPVDERVARHRRADGMPILRRLADGRVLRVSERPARSGGGIVGITIDVTEQLRTEQQLREALKIEAIGKLTGGMAHDFNNYLAVIMGNLELLKEFGFTDKDAAEWIDEARAGAVRAAELTRSLLAFARRQPLDPKPTDVNGRVAAVAQLLRRTLGEDVVLSTALAPDLWAVTIDGAQLDTGIVNLANNARDAMPSGGSLTIATRNARLDAAYARANLDAAVGDYVLIEMSDSGAGMAPEVAACAFEPFFTTKKPGHGTGLGLSMVYGFVKQSGGHIKIDSAVGHGTVVRLYLPRDGAAEIVAPAATGAPVVIPIGGTETILVVEDNEQMRQVAATTLARRGYRVIEAANGAAALAILDRRELPIDLLFTDIVMPGQPDGHQLARLAVERQPNIRILLTSGYPGGRFLDHGIDAPPANLLGKPYLLGELLRAVRAALDNSRV
jgi:PAS domain S-box-containing protein